LDSAEQIGIEQFIFAAAHTPGIRLLSVKRLLTSSFPSLHTNDMQYLRTHRYLVDWLLIIAMPH